MALRNILTKEDQTLYKKCRPVTEFNDRLHQLLDDMADTLIKSNGVGLAAPQVGVLRRVVLVIETNVEEDEDEYIIELINPEITSREGEQFEEEGCLSLTGVRSTERYPAVTVEYLDMKFRPKKRTFRDFEAQIVQHELDHFEGRII